MSARPGPRGGYRVSGIPTAISLTLVVSEIDLSLVVARGPAATSEFRKRHGAKKRPRLNYDPAFRKILAIAVIVFQLRVVTGTPKILSSWPR